MNVIRKYSNSAERLNPQNNTHNKPLSKPHKLLQHNLLKGTHPISHNSLADAITGKLNTPYWEHTLPKWEHTLGTHPLGNLQLALMSNTYKNAI